MNTLKDINKGFLPEFIFQIILHVIVFLFYSFDRNAPHFESYKLVFFLNYSVAVFIINYALLPQFLYKKKYALFVALLMLVVIVTILIEEYVLEKIYFPDTRGQSFQGFFYVLLDLMPVIAILSGYKFAWDLIRNKKLKNSGLRWKRANLTFSNPRSIRTSCSTT